jgi:hypothetical protein
MTVRITKKIKGYAVLPPEAKSAAVGQQAPASTPQAPAAASFTVIQMHEKLERPEVLKGRTYKIKSPLFEHALYVTINDIVLNAGTEFEMRRPFEIFINSKNMDHFQWIVALTRVMSAVFRKGGDVTFLVEELKAVFDPRGGYFKAGGVYMPSIVAELGNIIEQHLKMIGLIKDTELSEAQRALIAEKRAAFEAQTAKKPPDAPAAATAAAEPPGIETAAGTFPAGAAMCHKCNTQALVLLDGCQTCLNCGYSKCG